MRMQKLRELLRRGASGRRDEQREDADPRGAAPTELPPSPAAHHNGTPKAPRRRRSAAERQELARKARALREGGMTLAEVGRVLGISSRQVSRLLAPPDGAPRRRARPRKPTPEFVARVVALRQAGLSYGAIGRELGTSGTQARRLVIRAGGDPLKRVWSESRRKASREGSAK
jgi:DNA invertase Pin-like site-specific DNA recombinase